jgi:hypothetical protein
MHHGVCAGSCLLHFRKRFEGKVPEERSKDKTIQPRDKSRQDNHTSKQGRTRQDKTRRDKTKQSTIRRPDYKRQKRSQIKARQHNTIQDNATQRKTRQDKTRQDNGKHMEYGVFVLELSCWKIHVVCCGAIPILSIHACHFWIIFCRWRA